MSMLDEGSGRLLDEHGDYFVEPFYAWRVWRVEQKNVGEGVWWLKSVVFNDRWAPHERQDARCRRSLLRRLLKRQRRHAAPDQSCSCGIYAAESERVRPYLGREEENWAFGRVKLWGRIVECAHGFKAEHCYPERLYVVPRQLDGRRRGREALEIAFSLQDYGVPVEVLSGTSDEIIAAFELLDLELAASAR